MAARDAPDRPTNSCLPACTYAASTFVQPPQGRTGGLEGGRSPWALPGGFVPEIWDGLTGKPAIHGQTRRRPLDLTGP